MNSMHLLDLVSNNSVIGFFFMNFHLNQLSCRVFSDCVFQPLHTLAKYRWSEDVKFGINIAFQRISSYFIIIMH